MAKVNCPNCTHPHHEVTNSRNTTLNDIPGIRRWRECSKCKHRFSTFEYICEIPRGNVPKKVFHLGYDNFTNGKVKSASQKVKEALRRARARIELEEDFDDT